MTYPVTLIVLVLAMLLASPTYGFERIIFPGGWYTDARVNGRMCVSVINGLHLRTCAGAVVPLTPASDPLFIRLARDGRFAGMGWGDGILYEWNGVQWISQGMAFGNRPLIYDRQEQLVIVRGPGTFTGSIGWRFVADNGQLIATWETYDPGTPMSIAHGVTDLWEWTEKGDLRCGQGQQGLLCDVRGKRVQVEPGDAQFVNVDREGDMVALSTAKLAERMGVVIFATMDELYAMSAPPNPEPPEPEPPKPEPPEPPEPQIILPANVYATLVATRPKYPTPLLDGGARLLNEVAWIHRADGWGLQAKSGGTTCPQPQTNQTMACDILRRGTDGWDVLTDAEGVATPARSVSGSADTATFRAPVDPGTNPIPPEPPTGNLEQRVQVLEASAASQRQAIDDLGRRITQLSIELGALRGRVDALEAKPPGGTTLTPEEEAAVKAFLQACRSEAGLGTTSADRILPHSHFVKCPQ
ncbi:MAG: hypothetical protein ABWY78_06295 [Microvirga sp.]